jgi:hypothetical protein
LPGGAQAFAAQISVEEQGANMLKQTGMKKSWVAHGGKYG